MLDRRSLLLSALALLVPATASVREPGRPYWPTERWRADQPGDQAVDPALLAEADRRIRAAMPDVTGLLVVRSGYLVHERYFSERYGRNDPVKIRSVTKSITGALIGITLGDGLLPSLDTSLGELIPDRIPAGADPVAPSITVRHLLTMTAGWEWDITTDYERLISSEDWAAYTLSKPVVYEPGAFFAYNSGGSHLLSLIVEAVSGMDAADYAQDRLFTPLGIARPVWQRSPQGEAAGGFGLELTPRNMAKLGWLYINRGHWDGAWILPRDYVEASTSEQAAGDTTGDAAYGYQWWVAEADGLPVSFALGYGGQYIYIVPDRDLLVVMVKGFEEPPPFISLSRPLIEKLIVPAARPRNPAG